MQSAEWSDLVEWDAAEEAGIETVVAPASLNEAIAEGIRRIEDLVSGRVKGLTEEEFLAKIKC